MILVDSSIWIKHLRNTDTTLVRLLGDNQVLVHPFIIGEIACGNFSNRSEVLSELRDLPFLPVTSDDEVLYFIEQNKMMRRGIGYIDAHLLASVALAPPARLWTQDRQLKAISDTMNLAYQTKK